MESFDIFISYKRKSLNFANNLYYRLTQLGYSVFFDLEEMRRDRFDVQLLKYIDDASDVFVILEEGSLDACSRGDWEQDWFCKEIIHALKNKKNIIPILLDDYRMPPEDFFPDEMKSLRMYEAPRFDIAFFTPYLENLQERFLMSKPKLKDQDKSVFKLYSNRDTEVYLEGKLIGRLTGNAEEPFYVPVHRKGSYRFKGVDVLTGDVKFEKSQIEAEAEEEVEFIWEIAPEVQAKEPEPKERNQEKSMDNPQIGEDDRHIRVIKVGEKEFSMAYVGGGQFGNTYVKPFYISQFPITQNIWELVMGENPSANQEKVHFTKKIVRRTGILATAGTALAVATFPFSIAAVGAVGALGGATSLATKLLKRKQTDEMGHYPVEMVNNFDAVAFAKKLSEMTGLHFSLPTEVEWEYAARGGKHSQGFKYAGSNSIDDVAWFVGNSEGNTHPVGKKGPNELGLYDMTGNVWEWTYPESSRTGVRMGGSWSRPATECEVGSRDCLPHRECTAGTGFRVVLHDNT